MVNERKEIKRKARRLGFFLMSHQLFFQIGSAILLVILTAALSLAGMTYLEDAMLCIASDVMQLVAGVFFLVFYLVNRKKIRQIPMNKKKCSGSLFGKSILAIFAVNMILSLIEMVLVMFTGFSLSVPMDEMTNMNPVLMFVLVAVFPAIVEELLYRGVLYRYLRGHGVQFATIVSSAIFGLIHMNFLQFFFASFMGVVCCYIYEATGKLRYSMLLHLLNNSVLVLFSFLPLSDMANVVIQIVLGILSLIVAVVFLARRKVRWGGLMTDIGKETKRNCLYFFTSIPMLVFALACLAVCVYMSFA